jgi:hypothetical protein
VDIVNVIRRKKMEHKLKNFSYQEWECTCGSCGYGKEDFEKHLKVVEKKEKV